MADTAYDVIIVGAGPSGLLAAETLATQGKNVVVLEKDQIPGKDKPCGGFLTLKGVQEGQIPISLAERITKGISLSIPESPIYHVDYPTPVGIQITREALGRHLCQRAEAAGAKVLLQHQVTNCLREDRLWRIISRGSTKELQGTLLIGADGVNSTVARQAGIRPRFRKDQLGLTVQVQIALPEEEITQRFGKRMELYYGRGVCPYGYLWIFPKRDVVYVGVGSLLSAVTDRLERYLHRFIEAHPRGKIQLAGGLLQMKERALVPLTFERPSIANGVLLVGDAAGHCSAITGEGIHYALMAGMLAGEIATKALDKGDTSTRYLQRYENRWQRLFGGDLKWGLRLRNYFYQSLTTSIDVSSGLVSNQRFLKLAADIIVGIRPYRDTILRAIPFFLWQRFKRVISLG
ncbi:MAG: NAD(P)/FAD-dependent oxidoreductase [Candidatus Thorarchaeota archaeon]